MSKDITRRGFVKAATLAPLAFTPITLPQSSTRPENRFDIVVAGGGHNSLTTACYLAKAGYHVIVLEGRPMIGGGTKTAELTLSGFHHDTCSCDHQTIQGNPMLRNDELHLKDYGLEFMYPDPVFHLPFEDGTSITQWRDFDRTCEEIAAFSKKDAETYRRAAKEYEPIRRILSSNNYVPPGMWTETVEERIAKLPNAGVWQRRFLMSAWVNVHNMYENEKVRTFMVAPWAENVTGPMSGMEAYSKANLHPSEVMAKGGGSAIAGALGRCLEAHGGVILVNKPVTQLIVEGGKCVGVECDDGSSYRANKAVVSTIHIRELVKMAPKDLWGEDFLEGVRTFWIGGVSFNSHYALKSPMVFPKGNGTIEPAQSGTLSSVERGARYYIEGLAGEVDLEDPVLHITETSSADPTRCPPGMALMNIVCGRLPWNLKDGGYERWDDIKEKVADAHLRAVQRRALNFTNDMILARFIMTPLDFWRMGAGNIEGGYARWYRGLWAGREVASGTRLGGLQDADT